MTSTRVRLAAALCVAALTVAGCGSAGAASVQVKQTVRRALAALADGDGAGFCALATPSGQSLLAETQPGATCDSVVDRISRELSPSVKLGLLHAQVAKVTVAGNRATVRAADIGSSRGTVKGFLQASAPPTNLTRQADGSWKISG
ncbi:MAG: hypothetical protein ACR2NR_07120 [Solirubrobacteraceae bacterium]